MSSTDFEKKAEKYDSKVFKQQEEFNKMNALYITNILAGNTTSKMSQTLIDSIEENSYLAYYYKLRILAHNQQNFFGNISKDSSR